MIADNQTNTVYISNLWPEEDPQRFYELEAIITKAGYMVKLLLSTTDEDYYCRDYMPVQLGENDFVQFVFRPIDYYDENQIWEITNPVIVQQVNRLPQPRFSGLILDGGNIAKTSDKVIITDKVITDNRYQFNSDEDIMTELKKNLKCKVIVIPAYPNEETGHADGLIRFVNENTVLLNDTTEEPEKEWLNKVRAILESNELTWLDIPCTLTMDQKTANGLYINYLHVGNLIVVPQFKQKEDDRALQIMQQLFGTKNKVIPLDARWIAKFGGVLNCATWTVKE
ncbi:agmatine deiminase family protein [uncultured Sunxiuqinia sp.]|uniref:agmatine deiminase family protein n=1 Tax=uncultured Sunxiuqinia sp. TaxID=1573825 RepID=UPI0019CBD4B6|nr:agmatine deiminase family protein [Sunxiuqinia sp.]|tara:strand:+ start:20997 stop:21845 length:849 start_codon:yes stop_codon:yes gene_type:complete